MALNALFILNVFLLTDFAVGQECTKINAQCGNTILSKEHGVLRVVTDKDCEYNTKDCVNGLLFEDRNGTMFCISKERKQKQEELKCGRKGKRSQF